MNNVVADGWIGSQAPVVKEFEESLSAHVGQETLAVANGSVALILALAALEIGPGDEVIVPSLTYAATASSVVHVGAKPVFVDVSASDWCLEASNLESHLTPKTKAVIAVNLYGVVPELQAIRSLCDQRGIALIEDSAENFLGTYQGKRTGTFGHIGTYSFFANKTLHLGEGGAVTSGDSALLDRMRLLRGQGMSVKTRYLFDLPGFNFRLAAPQAALGKSLLSRIDRTMEARTEIEDMYDSLLAGVATRPRLREGAQRAPWIYTAQLSNSLPARVAALLAQHSVETRPVFIPMTQNPAFKNQVCLGCDNSSSLHNTGISLPTYEGLTQKEVRHICELVLSAND
jgi:perosamine synthetase